MERRSERIKFILDNTERIFADESFGQISKHKELLAEMPDYDVYLAKRDKVRQESAKLSIDAEMKPCWVEPLLSQKQEMHLSRKFNLLKSLARDHALCSRSNRAEQFFQEAMAIKEKIALANMRLVTTVMKRVFTNHREDMVNECYAAIYRAVDYYDWRRGVKFSTYAVWVARQNCIRANHYMNKEDVAAVYLGAEDINVPKEDMRDVELLQHSINQKFIRRLFRYLPEERDREILKMRFGINCDPVTLEQCGKRFSVTKERIRQLETKALKKLRKAIQLKGLVLEEIVS